MTTKQKTQIKPATKQATKPASKPAQKAEKKATPKTLFAIVAASSEVVASFLANAAKYHAGKGRLKEGKLTPDGVNWFSGGSRAASPADVAAMQECIKTGKPFIAGGEKTDMVKVSTGVYKIPDKNLVAGRKDSQAQFSALMLSLK